jgi:hypothetical protein
MQQTTALMLEKGSILEKFAGRYRHNDFARVQINEMRQGKDSAIDEPAEHSHKKEKSEETRHPSFSSNPGSSAWLMSANAPQARQLY